MKSYKDFLNESKGSIDHIDVGYFDDYVEDVDGFDKKDAKKIFKETDPGAFNYVDSDWGSEFDEVEDYLKKNKIPHMYVNNMGESGIIWLSESLNESKVSHLKGNDREWGDKDHGGIMRYVLGDKGAFVQTDHMYMEEPVMQNNKYMLVKGYYDYIDDQMNAYLVINKKKNKIVDYQVWKYDNLKKMYF